VVLGQRKLEDSAFSEQLFELLHLNSITSLARRNVLNRFEVNARCGRLRLGAFGKAHCTGH